MKIRDAINRFIVESDENNGGSISYTADQITPQFANECLARGSWSDGSEISAVQRVVLSAIVRGSESVDIA